MLEKLLAKIQRLTVWVLAAVLVVFIVLLSTAHLTGRADRRGNMEDAAISAITQYRSTRYFWLLPGLLVLIGVGGTGDAASVLKSKT